MSLLRSFALTVLIAIVLAGCGNYRYWETKPNCVGNGGIVVGTVTESATGEPIGFVTAELHKLDGDNQREHSDRTASNGEYQICNVPPGIYQLFLSHTRYAPVKVDSLIIKKGETIVVDQSMRMFPVDGIDAIITYHRSIGPLYPPSTP